MFKYTIHSPDFMARIQRLMRYGSIMRDKGAAAYNALVCEINARIQDEVSRATKQLRTQLEEATPTWRKCKDSLPPVGQHVLVLVNGDESVGALFWEHQSHEEGGESFKYWDDPFNDGQCWEWYDVTHWMPLPGKPETYHYAPDDACAFCGHRTSEPCTSAPLHGCEKSKPEFLAIDCTEPTA